MKVTGFHQDVLFPQDEITSPLPPEILDSCCFQKKEKFSKA